MWKQCLSLSIGLLQIHLLRLPNVFRRQLLIFMKSYMQNGCVLVNTGEKLQTPGG